MLAAQAERRAHTRASTGCVDALWFGNQHTNATLWIWVLGARDVIHRRRGHWTTIKVLGGRLGPFMLESNRHPIGVLNC